MLEIIEKTPRRIILRDQRPTAGLIAVVFTFLSLAGLIMLVFQMVTLFSDRILRFDGAAWMSGMIVFIALGVGFVALGVMASLHFWIGVACVLDKDSEAFILQRVDFFRTKTEEHSIYGISRVDVDENAEVHAFGVFIVLRSGQRIPVASYHQQDEDVMRATVGHLREFLRDW